MPCVNSTLTHSMSNSAGFTDVNTGYKSHSKEPYLKTNENLPYAFSDSRVHPEESEIPKESICP